MFKGTDHGPVPLVRAVKILDSGPFEDGDEGRGRFRRECEALATLDHRAVASYVTSGWTEDEPPLPFIVMEYVDGEQLRDAASRLEFAARVALIIEILDGLEHAHSRGVLHRDVKPSNIVVRRTDAQPLLVDFGTAYVFDTIDTKTLTRATVGSLGYIPPEVLAEPTHRSPTHDVFSVAVTLYEILAGRRPVVGAYQSLGDVLPALRGLDQIVQRGIAPEAERYASAGECQSALESWLRTNQRLNELGGVSPRGRRFAQRIETAKGIEDDRRAERVLEQAALGEAWERWRPEVVAGATAALYEACDALGVHYDGYRVSIDVGELGPKNESGQLARMEPVVGLLRNDKPWKFGVAECVQFHNVLPVRGGRGDAMSLTATRRMRSGGGQHLPPRHFVPRCFVLYSDRGGERSPAVIRHATVCVEIPGKTLDEQVANAIPVGQMHGRGEREPQTLGDVDAIRSFVVDVLELAMF